MKLEPFITKTQFDRLVLFAPRFATALMTGVMPQSNSEGNGEIELDLRSLCRCIAGETYKFTSGYYYPFNPYFCEKCRDFSNQFLYEYSPSYVDMPELEKHVLRLKFQKLMDSYLHHVECKHQDLSVRQRDDST